MTAGSIAVPTIVPLRAPTSGKFKNCIDTTTKIEICSDTEGAAIFFTLNGSRPEPNQTIGNIDAKATFTYREPFTLPAGKRTIKALARITDGRESLVVSKMFDVEQVGSVENKHDCSGVDFSYDIPASHQAKRDVQKFASSMMPANKAWEEVQKMKQNEESITGKDSINDSRRAAGPPRFMSSRLGERQQNGHNHAHVNGNVRTISNLDRGLSTATLDDSRRRWRDPPDDATQALRLQRDTDFLKCIYCFATRPSDPFARFCNECGNPIPPLPVSRLPPPEPGQMGTCVSCKTRVPFNTPNCLVCETPLHPQLAPQASIRLADKLLCVVCGTANPANLKTCITCAATLARNAQVTPGKVSLHGNDATMSAADQGRMRTCGKCNRINSADARFCDWCGTKPSAASTSPLTCSKCRATNGPYAQFCGTCGSTLAPPVQFGGVTFAMPGDSSKALLAGTGEWMPTHVFSSPLVEKHDAMCQTVGLFYPSEREIHHKHKQLEEKMNVEKESRDRNVLTTAISPGRGYWRKQMDHICGHLKAHAVNSADFRALIGEPRMGKLLTATVNEDGYELSLTVTFALRGTDDSYLNKAGLIGNGGGKENFLSSYTRGRSGSFSGFGSMESLDSSGQSSRMTGRSKKSGKNRPMSASKKRVVINKSMTSGASGASDDSATAEDKKLLKEVGKNGEGRATEIQQLIEEGANANCLNKDSIPVLQVAVLNKHADAVPVLIQEGADVNRKGPNNGNTALHEAISLGPAGLPVIDALLGCGASASKKNDKGDTPFDLAVKSGYDSIAQKMATFLGQATLTKMTKPKSSSGQDI